MLLLQFAITLSASSAGTAMTKPIPILNTLYKSLSASRLFLLKIRNTRSTGHEPNQFLLLSPSGIIRGKFS